MQENDFFTVDGRNLKLGYIIVLEEIGNGAKRFKYYDEEHHVIIEIANISVNKSVRVHKVSIINEEGETRELKVDFVSGKLRLSVKD